MAAREPEAKSRVKAMLGNFMMSLEQVGTMFVFGKDDDES
jgi:hypothetical protein